MFFEACSSQAPTVQPSSASAPPKADVYTLDVVIFSPISIVQYKNGAIDVLMPNIDKHTYGTIKGMNDCGLAAGNKQDEYRLDFSYTTLPTSVDPQNAMPNEVKIDNNAEPVRVDPLGLRFGKVSLPAPREILPIHLDDEGLSIYTPGSPEPKGHLYPTQIALRYTVPADPQLSLTNTTSSTKVCPMLQAAQLDKEEILLIAMGPPVDDDTHQHAITAFRAERDFLPPLKREIDYPMEALIPKKDDKRHRTSDCQAPIILVLNADMPGLMQK